VQCKDTSERRKLVQLSTRSFEYEKLPGSELLLLMRALVLQLRTVHYSRSKQHSVTRDSLIVGTTIHSLVRQHDERAIRSLSTYTLRSCAAPTALFRPSFCSSCYYALEYNRSNREAQMS
jgi:hypothetical protein